VLVMTATPIPRTLAMTLYGDLDLSVIDQLPPGRTPISTRVFNEKQRSRVYESVASELAKGHQAYVVYPLVEESEKLDLEDATQGVEKLAQVFPQARVGLLHGRMKGEEKDAVMEAFRGKELDLLVCTTVVEVGVDVPNASVMVVEHAERFGLSQLHQLRGRVGRGAAASYCYLIAGAARSWESTERLGVMERSSDGFVIAEKDLEIRGHAPERPARAGGGQPGQGRRSLVHGPGRGPAHPGEGPGAEGPGEPGPGEGARGAVGRPPRAGAGGVDGPGTRAGPHGGRGSMPACPPVTIVMAWATGAGPST
jgi:hypothetical protein